MSQSKITVEQKTGSYTSFKFAGLSEVQFIKSDDPKIVLTGIKDEMDKIDIDSSDGILQVMSKNRSRNDDAGIHAKIYAQNIESLNANAIGFVGIPHSVINSEKNNLVINAAGSVDIQMNVETIDCTINATANVNFEGSAKNGRIRLSAVANLNITKFQKGSVNMDLAAIAHISQ